VKKVHHVEVGDEGIGQLDEGLGQQTFGGHFLGSFLRGTS
jgi:hypothetical protein